MENVNVPYNTKTISSCLECPYHKMYPLSRKKKKIICTQTNEEVEVKDIEYFSIMSMCPYKQKASTENEIAKISELVDVIHANITMVRMENLTNRKGISGLLVDVRYGVLHRYGVTRGNGCQENGRRD